MLLKVVLTAAILIVTQNALANDTRDEPKRGICLSANEMIFPVDANSREETMVTLKGDLPNACWDNVRTDVTYSESAGRYDIVVLADQVEFTPECARQSAEFKTTASLGFLASGKHAVWAWGVETREIIVVP